jgi:dipeptidyl-peptidase-4
MKRNYLLIGALAAMGMTSAFSAAAQRLSIEECCDLKLNAPNSIKEMRSLANGETYAAISDDGTAIEVFSYKTGEKLSTLFDVNTIKGDVKISSFDGYELSANETKILLWNSTEKIYRRSFRARYYVYDVARGTMKEVSTGGPQQGAVISHDGRLVAYMRDNNIHISNLDYGTDTAITTDGEKNKIIYGTTDWAYEEEFGVTNTMRWSADDNTLAFMRFDESEVPTYGFDLYSGYCSPMPEYESYPGRFEYKYPLAGCDNSIVEVRAYNLDNRTTKTMDLKLAATDYVPSVEFGADGNQLMVMVLNRDQNDLKLYKVNPASTVPHLVYTDKSTAWLSPAAYQMVDYSATTFIIGSERSGYRHLYEYDYNGNLKRALTSGDYNVTDYYGHNTKTGEYYLQCTKRGAINRNVAKVDTKGTLTLLHDQDGFESARFSKSLGYYVRTYSNAATPRQYTLWSAKGSKIKDLELNRAYAEKYAGAPRKEFLTVKNDEGQDMNAYIIKPVDFDASKKYPLLMYQYNGPDSQEVLNTWKVDGLTYLVQEGYIVALVDGRGTGNRSRQWANAVYKQLGKYETLDQLAGTRYFASLPFIDSERVACFGWSYGGYMTLRELTAPGNPFKVGIAMAAVTDWRYYDSIYTERYMLTPQQNQKGYDEASALNKTQGLSVPLLIMSGTADDNVHYYNTLKYTSKLTSEGKICDMMSFTAFEHSLPMCNARTMLYTKVKDFLDLRLK